MDLIARNARLEVPAFFKVLDGWIPLESPGHYQERLRHMLGTRLEAIRCINELCGIVTVAQEKARDALRELPQIIVEGEPPPRPSSAEALRLLATAKGSGYDESLPPSSYRSFSMPLGSAERSASAAARSAVRCMLLLGSRA